MPRGLTLLPLRLFLGVTFTYAGLSKLADDRYFSTTAAGGVHRQMVQLAPTSPIRPLVDFAAHHSTSVGALIALGELAVGVGALAGLFTRLAAAGGMLLALSFWLTVSWNTHPYYYGSDVVFLFAWTPLLLAGAGAYSLDEWRARRAAEARGPDAERRALVLGAQAGAGLAVLGAVAAAFARVVAGPTRSAPVAAPSGSPSPTAVPAGPPAPSASPAAGGGGRLIRGSAGMPVGGAVQFTAPNGDPAWLLHPAAGSYRAYSAVCTHAGCLVDYDPGSREFLCPCHGSVFAGDGSVVQGPAVQPLPPVTVHPSGDGAALG